MSSIADIRAKMKSKYGDSEEEKKKKQKQQNKQEQTRQNKPASEASVSNAENVRSKMNSKYKTTYSHVDGDYINSFFKDAQSYLNSAGSKYSGMGYSNSQSTYEEQKKKFEDLRSRSWDIRQYLKQNKSSMKEEDYSSYMSLLDSFDKASISNDYSFYKKNEHYSQWDSQDAYNEHLRQQKINNMSSEEIKAEQEAAQGGAASEKENASKSRQPASSYLTGGHSYSGSPYAASQNQTEIKRDTAGIAYTTADGRNVTWQELYDSKFAEEDLAKRIGEYSKNDDWKAASSAISTVEDTETDYQIAEQLSRTNVAYDKDTALKNGTTLEDWEAVNKKRQYISDKYGVDFSNIYDVDNQLVSLMEQLDSNSEKEVFKYFNELTDDEKKVLSYIDTTQGREAAIAWYKDRENLLKKRYAGQVDYGANLFGQEMPVFGSAASVATSLGSAVEAIFDLATGDTENTLARATSGIRGGVSSTQDWMIGDFDAFDFLYNTGMSLVDSQVAGNLLPFKLGSGKLGQTITGGGLALGLSATAQGINDAKDRGMSDDGAILNGIINGVNEMLFESWSFTKTGSLGSFLQEIPEKTYKDIFKNLASNILTNAEEEFLTELSNVAYDTFVNSDFSQLETSKRTLMANGMDESEATKKAWGQIGRQLAEAAASGALMGFGTGNVGRLASAYDINRANAQHNQYLRNTGKRIIGAEGGFDALQALADEVAGVSDAKMQANIKKQAGNVTGEIATGKNIVGKAVAAVKNNSNATKVGRLYNTVQTANNLANASQNQADIAKSLERKGFNAETANDIAEALVASYNGQELTKAQEKLMESVRDSKVVQEAISNIMTNDQSTMGQRNQNIRDFQEDIKLGNISRAYGISKDKLKEMANGNLPTEEKVVSDGSYEVSEEGKTVLDGKEVKLDGLREMEDGSIMVATADSQTADPSEVTYSSKGQALVYENYVNIETTTDNPVIANMDVADRSELAKVYDPASGAEAKVQFLGLNQAYWYGFEGISMDEKTLPKNSLVRSITAEQRAFAYELGRKAGEKAAKTQDAGMKAAYEAAVEKLGGKEAAAAVAKKNEGKVVLEDNIREASMTKKQRASYQMAEIVSKAVSTTIHVYHGVKEYGKYDPATGEIWLNINGNFKGSSMMVFTLAHELVHMAKQWKAAEFKSFADYLLEQYGKKGVSVEGLIRAQMENAKLNGYTLNEHEAYEEVIADACMRMLLDSDALQKMAAYKEQNPGRWQQIIDAIKKFIDKIRQVFKGAEPDSVEAALYKEFDDAVKNELENRFVTMVMDAGEYMSTIRNAFGKGTVVEVNADGEFTLAKGEVNGAKKFLYNDYTWETGGRDTLAAALKAEGFSKGDINAALTIMDGKHKLVKELAEQFPEQSRINQATVTTDLKDGHSVLSALVSNGDYPVNIDLLMVCKKRKAYQRVINRLCETGMIQQATVDALAIAEINKILGKYGFETACLGCFVESRRLRIQEWANTIVKEWNAEVKKRNPNAKAFGFGKGEATLTENEVMQLVGELEGHDKNDKGNLNLGQGSAVKRMGVLLDKVPSLRKTLSVEDLITPDGLSNLRKLDSNLFSMVKSRYGSNSPKFVQEFNPYNHELAMYGKVPTEYKSLREYLYAIGGARMQSFSDFIVENWFDYCQIVADLAARKLPMHTYTKEISLAKLFGLTGIKINMSLIPDIDRSLGKEFAGLTRNADGELELIWADKDRYKATGGKSYMQSINFADAIALQNDPRYSSNVGTIAVGVSDKHILMMLDDARIRMIIPYHSSGMNPIFADLMGTSYYKDYTMFQNTTVKQLYNSKGEPVSLSLDKTQTGKLTSGFQFNEVLQELGDARAAAQAYKEWCADASKHTITIKGETYTAELTPKFDSFSWHDNYYKLLEDFNTYDCISEEAAQQGDVQQVYPEDFDKILTDELSAQEGHRQKQEANQSFDKAMGEIESYLSEHTKADTVFYAEQHGIKLAAKDKKLGAADKAKLADLRKGMKNSLPKVDSEGRQLSAEQMEFFKDSVVRDADGKLMVMYHGTANGGAFTIFEGDKLSNNTLTSQIGQGFYFTNVRKEAESYMKNVDIYGRVSNGKNPNLHQVYLNIARPFDVTSDTLDIEKAKSVYMDGNNGHFFDSYISFYLNKKTLNGKTFTKAEVQAMSKEDKVSAYVDYISLYGTKEVLKNMVQAFNFNTQGELLASMKNRLGYDGIVEEFQPGQYQYVAFSSEQIKNVDNQKPTTNPDIRYSMPKVPAPTFYSQMAKVVDGVKQEKLGAASVVSMLRGKGVKAEEIKWSGIETWLEGKKSVTKAELQAFIAGSMLQIEEEVLDNKDRPYTEDQQKRLDEYETKRDEVAKRLADEWKKLTGEEFPIRNTGSGLESAVTQAILEANSNQKKATFEGRLLEKLKKDLKEVIENNDDFGFDSWMDAKRSIHRHRRDFIKHYEMSTNDKAVIVKYCNALNAYNELPNMISDTDTDRLRAIARETDPWNRKIREVKHEHNEEEAKYMTNWKQYSLDGGRNYREMLFRIPGSTYSNAAMFAHWKERNGVLAHARIQDMDTFIGKMLFIEEIQSDWHNAGHKDGYDSDADKVVAADKLRELKSQKEKLFEEMDANNKAYDAFLTEYWETDMSDAEYSSRAEKQQVERMEFLYKERELNRQINEIERDIEAATPDAPFKDTYHEYVLKRLLRMAAEQDYDSIGWTTADVQMDRWNPKRKTNEQMGISDAKNPNAIAFEDGYRIEYDQDIPKFLSKLGKKWDAKVGKTVLDNGTEVWSMAITDSMKDSVLYEGQPKYSMPKVNSPYSYEALISKPDMVVTPVGGNIPTNRADVAQLAKKNAASIGKTNKDGSVSVHVDDIDTDVILSTKGLRHGLRRTQDPLNKPNYIVTVKAGEILKNSIRINEITPAEENVKSSYVLMGAARDANGTYVVRFVVNHFDNNVMAMDVLYAVNAKKELAATKSPRLTAEPLSVTSSTISIEELLDLVNQYFPDILPEDALKHYGYDSRPEGDLGDDALYKTPNSRGVSSRQLLADAFDELVQNSKERELMDKYRSNIAKVEDVQDRLTKLRGEISKLTKANGDKAKIAELTKTAKELAELIDKYDRNLLDLEASKPLKDVLARAKSAAYQKAKQRNEDALKEYRQQVSERFDRGVDSRRRTAMRHQIQRVVGELNQLLLSNDKKRHVPDSLKKAVADALSLVNMDTVGAEERAAKYADMIAKENSKANPDQDKIDAYTVTMENILRQGDKMGQRLKELRDAYEEISESDDPDIANAYDPVIAGSLKELAGSIGNTPLRNMTLAQLEDVYNMYRMVLTRVRDANKSLIESIKESISNRASSVVGEVKQVGGEHKYRAAFLDFVKKFGWDNMKPVYAFEHIGSKTLTEAFNNVRRGEDIWAVDVTEAREYYLDKSKTYGYDSWDFKKKYRFKSASDIEFELTLEQILSLYAYSKRDQAHDHLRLGGFVFDSNIETYKEKDGKKSVLKYKVNTADAHQITPEILAKITDTLTKEQMSFVDEMQEYLSTVMGAKGNEITMKMYGVKLFKEKFYFPLKSAKQFMFEQNEVSGEVRIKNSGFTNKVVTKANNPVILNNFMDVWAGHVNDMSMYHAFVLPLEDFNRIFNYNSPKQENQPSVSVKGTIQNAYSPAAVGYVRQLITDLNGGARTDSTTGIINKLMGLFKKGAVFASMSVTIQQPSAVARATALVDTKYFIGPKVDHKRHKALWDEVKQYAPVAIIKEMGYFDTNMGKSTQDFITGKEYSGLWDKMKALVVDSSYRDELLSKAPALADEIAWCGIWEAVKRETKAKNPGMDVKSEAFLKKAGERFTDVITKTQVYDSVLSRSGLMRSKDTGMKMATAFMAEPTTSINMIADALLQGKRGNRKYARSAIGAVIAAQILNSILVSFVYAGRDDDEDETYLEKYIGTFTAEMIDSLNPATYIPFIKDIVSIVQGYDVERSDMAVISDLWKAYENLSKDYVSPYRKVEGFVGSIAQIFGLPVKNIMRDARAIYQTVDSFVNGQQTTAAGVGHAVKGAITGNTASDGQQLYEAYLNGDTAHIARVKARFKDQTAINTAIRKALRENDPRIHEAAIAWNANDLDEYMRIAKGIIAEKHFAQDDVVMAIRGEASAISPDDGTTTTSKAKGLFTAEKFAEAIAQGDQASAYSAKNDIIQTAQKNGKTAEEAEKSFASSATSELKDLYLSGKVSENKAINAMVTYCGKTEDEALADVQYWTFKQDYPDVYADDQWFDTYYEKVADSGISIDVYMDYRNEVRDITGEGKKDRRMAVINSLPITSAQKDALYYAEGWTESKIHEAPWH